MNGSDTVCLCRPDGYLYDREAILEHILHQKKESELVFADCVCTYNVHV